MHFYTLILTLLPILAWGQACVVHSEGQGVDVTLCQVNRSIPSKLFTEGFCQPQLKDQSIDVRFVEQCPSGAFGVCQGAFAGGGPYQQDIHYYGVKSDALYLKPACIEQYRGTWSDLP